MYKGTILFVTLISLKLSIKFDRMLQEKGLLLAKAYDPDEIVYIE